MLSSLLWLRDPGPSAPERSADAGADETYGLDSWLLADGFADRLVIEIDWVAGAKPGPLTVAALQEILVKYGPPGRPVEVQLDDEIPYQAWEETRGARDRVSPLVERFADLADESDDPESGIERRYALFVTGLLPGSFVDPWILGYSSMWPVRRGGEFRKVRGVVISRALHRRGARFWISVDRLERRTLVHEFGHQFGLVRNSTHLAEDPYRLHCTSLVCAMAVKPGRVVPTALVGMLLNPFSWDYCERCQADIRAAQAVWRRRLAADPGYRAKLAAAIQGVSGNWEFALELIVRGYHAEAVELLASVALATRDHNELEYVSFVRQSALEALGRFSQAVEVIDEMLARGHAISFHPERMRILRASLLRRAGRLDEALAAARAGLADDSTRDLWRVAAAAILSAAGRDEEARTLRREALERVLAREAQAGTDVERRSAALEAAQVHAALGEAEPARAALDRVGSPYPLELIAVVAALGDLDRAAELLREFDGGGLFDPCRLEELEPMFGEARFANVLGHCPIAVGHDSSRREEE